MLTTSSAADLVRHTLDRYALFWLRLLIAGGIILLCVVLPFKASLKQMIFIAGALLVLAAFRVFISAPPLGLIALLVTALVIPSPPLPGGLNAAILLLGFLVGLWLLDMLVRQHRISLPNSRTTWPLLAFAAVSVLSFVIGQLGWFTTVQHAPLDAQLGGLSIFLLSSGAFLLTAHQVDDLCWLQRITWIFIALGALFISGWIVSGVGAITSKVFQIGATANSMFWLWLVALALSQAMFNQRLSVFWRLALGTVSLATLYVAYFLSGDWKSGYLPTFVVVAVLLTLRSRRIALLVAAVAPVAAIYVMSQAIDSDQYSYSTRLDAWIVVLNMVKASPLFGFGPANYHFYTPLFPIRGFSIQFNSHNQYLDIIAQVGLLGLAVFVWLACEIGMLGWRLRHSAPPGFAQAYVVGALAGFVGTLASGMLVDWFLPFVYNIGLDGYRGGMLAWLFLGGLVSIDRIVRRHEREKVALVTHNSEELICLKT